MDASPYHNMHLAKDSNLGWMPYCTCGWTAETQPTAQLASRQWRSHVGYRDTNKQTPLCGPILKVYVPSVPDQGT